jgi:hypothetical protein
MEAHMKYASTMMKRGRETAVVVLPLAIVPGFDPENPHPDTYGVPDEVEVGWVRDADSPSGWAPPPPPTRGEEMERYAAAVQGRLDAFARERGYDGIVAACSYAASSVPAYRSDALVCVDLRDRTWRAFFDATAGEPLLGLEDVTAALPVLGWGD